MGSLRTAVVVGCWAVTVAVALVRDTPLIDLQVYLAGAERLLAGQDLYAQPHGALPFTYPPFAALLVVPLALLPTWLPWLLVPLLSCAALMALWPRSWPRLDDRWLLVVPASLLLEPVWATLHFGQVNLLLTALALLDLGGRDHRGRGVATGLAAAVKLTPLVFAAYLVVTGQWRALRMMLGVVAATVLVPVVLLPGEGLAYWTHVLPDAGRIGAPWYATNQSLMGVLARLGGEAGWVRPLWLALAVAAVLACLAVARLAWQRGETLVSVTVVGLASLLASPVSWSHHWVWVVPMAVVLARYAGRPATAAWTAGFVLAPHLWLPRHDDRELAWTWEHVPGDLYVWLGLLWLGVLGRHLRAGARAAQESAPTVVPWRRRDDPPVCPRPAPPARSSEPRTSAARRSRSSSTVSTASAAPAPSIPGARLARRRGRWRPAD